MGPEAAHTCKDDRICEVFKVAIDVLGIQSIWSANYTK